MVELRAVKEELEHLDSARGFDADNPLMWEVEQDNAVIAAARLWLASQEQTPDERRCEHGLIGAHHIAHYGCDGNGCGQQCPGGAALAGFHPQPEGDER